MRGHFWALFANYFSKWIGRKYLVQFGRRRFFFNHTHLDHATVSIQGGSAVKKAFYHSSALQKLGVKHEALSLIHPQV